MPDPNQELAAALAEPFDADEVKFKPAVVSGNRAMALCYVDARVIMDRLDDVFGVGGWETSYRELPDGVVCKLRVRIGEQWCEHEDVGSFSHQPDDGDKVKAGFSDALKRVAVQLGIGRYLYRMPQQWCDFDPQKKQFVRKPTLPASGQPTPRKPEPAPSTPAPRKKTKDEILSEGITRLAGVKTEEQLRAATVWALAQGFTHEQMMKFNGVWERIEAELSVSAAAGGGVP